MASIWCWKSLSSIAIKSTLLCSPVYLRASRQFWCSSATPQVDRESMSFTKLRYNRQRRVISCKLRIGFLPYVPHVLGEYSSQLLLCCIRGGLAFPSLDVAIMLSSASPCSWDSPCVPTLITLCISLLVLTKRSLKLSKNGSMNVYRSFQGYKADSGCDRRCVKPLGDHGQPFHMWRDPRVSLVLGFSYSVYAHRCCPPCLHNSPGVVSAGAVPVLFLRCKAARGSSPETKAS